MGEYISGGGQWGHPDPALLPEGLMMVSRLVDDLTALDGVQVALARDPSLPPLRPDVEDVCAPDWIEAIRACDAAWIVAPECDGILLDLTRKVEASGRKLLGCRSDAVAVAASKLATAELLRRAGIPVIPTPGLCGSIPPSTTGWVAKPDDGAGACDMIATADRAFLEDWMRDRQDTHIVQPRIDGLSASAVMLARGGEARVLTVNSQNVELTEGGCRYLGGVIGAYGDHLDTVAPIARSIAALLPGLWGPVGVDFILTKEGPVVVEINPRLTTLWAGLHEALGQNPAALVLELDQRLPQCRPIKTVAVTVS